MPDSSLVALIVIIALALGFGLVNGFNDAANAIATVVGTRVLSPRKAITLAAVANLAGALTGLEVAKTIVGDERNAWAAAKKIAEWINLELEPNYDVGFASAKEVLEHRKGDCSEHTVLMVAFCRSVGIPARAAVGVMYGEGIFAYHMWPEVFVGEWVGLDAKWLAVDKKSGEYYTDATHIKLGDSALDEGIFQEMGQAMSEVIGKLKIEVVAYKEDQ